MNQGPHSSASGGAPNSYSDGPTDEPAKAPALSSFLGIGTPTAPSAYQNSTATALYFSTSNQRPLRFTGAASSPHVARPAFLCGFFLLISFLVQGAMAFSHQDKAVDPIIVDRSLEIYRDQSITTYSELQSRELNKFFKTFADLFSEYVAN